jgi:hypothetical protein
MHIPPEYLGPYIGSNVVSVLLIVAAIFRPRAIRWIYVVIFVAAGLLNGYTAITQPSVYVDGYAPLAIAPYRSIITGMFAEHVQMFVLVIAAGQILIGGLLADGDRQRRLGVIGATIFLVAIAPLGVGSAFPATLLMAAALWVMMRRWRHAVDVHSPRATA